MLLCVSELRLRRLNNFTGGKPNRNILSGPECLYVRYRYLHNIILRFTPLEIFTCTSTAPRSGIGRVLTLFFRGWDCWLVNCISRNALGLPLFCLVVCFPKFFVQIAEHVIVNVIIG